MTITEAKKIIEMCVDAVKKGDGDDAKIYVNKEYVLSILDMVESIPNTNLPDHQPWTYPTDPNIWPPTWPQVWYGKDGTEIPEGFEKVPWWVWHRDYNQFTCDNTSTGSKPSDADVVMTSATTDPLKNTAKPGFFANITDKDMQAPLTDELKRFRENQAKNTKTFDASPKRTDYIDDWAGGSTTGGGSFNHSMSSIIDDSSNTYCNC